MVFCFIYPEIKARLDRLVFRIPFSYYEGQGDLDISKTTICISMINFMCKNIVQRNFDLIRKYELTS